MQLTRLALLLWAFGALMAAVRLLPESLPRQGPVFELFTAALAAGVIGMICALLGSNQRHLNATLRPTEDGYAFIPQRCGLDAREAPEKLVLASDGRTVVSSVAGSAIALLGLALLAYSLLPGAMDRALSLGAAAAEGRYPTDGLAVTLVPLGLGGGAALCAGTLCIYLGWLFGRGYRSYILDRSTAEVRHGKRVLCRLDEIESGLVTYTLRHDGDVRYHTCYLWLRDGTAQPVMPYLRRDGTEEQPGLAYTIGQFLNVPAYSWDGRCSNEPAQAA